MVSVIIPAHNEAGTIERCLSTLLDGAHEDEFEILVVCNGCTDGTAQIARSFAPPVRVFETDATSKAAALNLGDSEATRFPRVYVDADVKISADAVRRVADVLNRGLALAAAPRMEIDLSACSPAVLAYYAVWTRLPYVTDALVGSGVYALSKEGRYRFDRFPETFAEDSYVRALFEPSERTVVERASFCIRPPRTLGGLVRIKARQRIGQLEVEALVPGAVTREGARQRAALLALARDPRRWPYLMVYAYVKLASVGLHAWRYRLRGRRTWDRDESGRQAPHRA